jgi:hypothetical protein
MAYTAYKTSRMLKGIINSEKKVHSSSTSSTVNSTGYVVCMSQIIQGDDYTSREGRSILLKSLEMKNNLQKHASATFSTVRVIIFKDTQQRDNSSDTPLITDVLQTAQPMSLRNPDPTKMRRFQILKDKRVTLSDQLPAINWDHYLPLNYHLKFNGTAANDSAQGSIFLLAISDEATNVPTPDFQWRLRFYDN